MMAHVAGVPLEETLPWLSGPGAGLVLLRLGLVLRLRRRRNAER
jgi:hypothetical protein